MAEITPKSPSSPFSKGRILFDIIFTPLWKRGEGEIFDEFQIHPTNGAWG